MPKLNKTTADKAAKAEADWGEGFQLLDPGDYLAKLSEVESRDGQAAAYWAWKYSVVGHSATLFDNTSLSDKAIGRLGRVFKAFGVSADTDTDMLIGRTVCLRVGKRTIQSGDRKGEMANTVQDVLPASEHPDYTPYGPSPDDYGAYGDTEPF